MTKTVLDNVKDLIVEIDPSISFEEQSIEETVGQYPNLAPPTQHLEQELRNKGYKVIFKTGTKRITIFRFLLAKLCYDPLGISVEDLLTIYELQVYLEMKSDKDPKFNEKYGLWLITTEHVIQKLGTFRNFPIRIQEGHRKLLIDVLKPLLPGASAYFGLRKQPRIWNSFRVQLRNPLKPLPRKVPKPYVGVGYKDKGSRKDLAKDGSPHWKEVASSNSYHEVLSPILEISEAEFIQKDPPATKSA
jgi:hypothetical protein